MLGRTWTFVGLLLGSLAVFVACSDDGSTPKDGNTASADGETLFRALQPELVARCGGQNGTCHVKGTYREAPTWLAEPDPYLSAKHYRGIFPATRDPSDSILLTQVRHDGPPLTAYKDLYDKVASWIVAEVPPPPLPSTAKLSVQSGYNSVPLDLAAPGLSGASISFLATENNGVLSLSALRVHAPINANVTLESPFFVILPRSGKVEANPDVNGFSGALTVPAGTTADLFTGKIILLRWDSSGQMEIVFSKLASTPGQGVAQSCNALESFKSSAVPAMRAQLDVVERVVLDGGEDGGTTTRKGSCLGCHGEAADPQTGKTPAVNAMDLSTVDTDPAFACAQARLWIDFKNKPQSILLQNPQGKTNPQHPIAPLPADHPILTGIAAWVNAENEK